MSISSRPIDVWAKNVAGNAGQPLEIEHACRRNLLPGIESLMPDTQPLGELPQPADNFRTFFDEVDHGR